MDKIVELYRYKYKLENFYQLAANKIKNNDLINGYYKYNFPDQDLFQNELVISEVSDLRVDLPIWFGDENSCKLKLMVLGLEPRNTKNKYNIEKIGKHVFATPFALEHWTNRNKYFRGKENKK